MKLVLLPVLLVFSSVCIASEWTRLRGPQGQGVAENSSPPVDLSDEGALQWRTGVPRGHSSPVVWGDHIYLTAEGEGTLLTMAIDRDTGEIVWEQPAPLERIERVHPFSSPAASTPVVDEDGVYVYFGSFGLISYDHEGNERWQVPIAIPISMHGSANSPTVHKGKVILVRDSNATDSYIAAYNTADGSVAWQTERRFYTHSYSTPAVATFDDQDVVLAPGTRRFTTYDAESGDKLWTVEGFSMPMTLPLVSDDRVFMAVNSFGETPERTPAIVQWETYARYDLNDDGRVSFSEVPEGEMLILRDDIPRETPGSQVPIRYMLRMADSNQDQSMDKMEFQGALRMFSADVPPSLTAMRPGGSGNVTETHVDWRVTRGVPEMPSPILYRDRIYMIKNGGVLSCINPSDGEAVYRTRLDAGGQYCAGLIAANGYLYASSNPGVIVVFEAGDELNVVSKHDLQERIFATPAIVDDSLIVRTEEALYLFDSAG